MNSCSYYDAYEAARRGKLTVIPSSSGLSFRSGSVEVMFLPADMHLLAVTDPTRACQAVGLLEVVNGLLFHDGEEQEISGADFYQEVTAAMGKLGLWPNCKHRVDPNTVAVTTSDGIFDCRCKRCDRAGSFQFVNDVAEIQWEEEDE